MKSISGIRPEVGHNDIEESIVELRQQFVGALTQRNEVVAQNEYL